MKRTPPPNPDHLQFLAAYEPRITELAMGARALVLEEAPGSIELIYDAYSAVSSGYSFTGRPGDTFVYIAAYAKRVNLGFYWGAYLKDPRGLLQGSGKQSRHLPVEELSDLAKPHVRAFVRQAVKMAERGTPVEEPGASIVRAIYPRKKRPV